MSDETSNVTTLQAAGSWTGEANFTGTHDGNCMTETLDGQNSGEFSFNFSSVTGTIDGIEVMVHCIAGDTDDDIVVGLYDTTSTWRTQTIANPGAGSTCADCVDKTLGGSADTWSGTWTAAHITSTAFRIRLSSLKAAKSGGYWAADHATCKVYYTETAPTTTQSIIFQMT